MCVRVLCAFCEKVLVVRVCLHVCCMESSTARLVFNPDGICRSGKEFVLPYASTTTVKDLKSQVEKETCVAPNRQKYLVRACVLADTHIHIHMGTFIHTHMHTHAYTQQHFTHVRKRTSYCLSLSVAQIKTKEGKNAADDSLVANLKGLDKPNTKIMMMG